MIAHDDSHGFFICKKFFAKFYEDRRVFIDDPDFERLFGGGKEGRKIFKCENEFELFGVLLILFKRRTNVRKAVVS